MTNISNPLTLHFPDTATVTFTLPSKKSATTLKTYTLVFSSLDYLFNYLGKGTSGCVLKGSFSVETNQKVSKQKLYAVKRFNSMNDDNEFNAHKLILKKLHDKSWGLKRLGIDPGTGIEKEPLTTYYQFENKFIVKRLYTMNLKEAINAGLLKDPRVLIIGSIQLVEGLISLILIGALYFDFKPHNILVGRKDEIEFGFSDFQHLNFLSFDESDDRMIQKIFINMPPYLTIPIELTKLDKLRSLEKPAEAFTQALHSLYVFMLGALFFEMITSQHLFDFVNCEDFCNYLTENGAPSLTNQFREEWNELPNKKANTVNLLFEEFSKAFLEPYSFLPTKALDSTFVQEKLYSKMLQSGVTKEHAVLVLLMLNPNPEERIDVHNVRGLLIDIQKEMNSGEKSLHEVKN